MECKSKSDTSNNIGHWNHLIITQNVPEQHTRKPRNQGTTENSHIGHCTHSAESANVKVQNICNMRNNITCSTNRKYRTTATLYTV